ncbi:hypothetical protein Dsin_006613 [Dipteronia sinensis]|uniref:CCHC-type domain-containing protein n=1 Tax=Dipteronia sinensis TaxID=43782 RepID=A0AAE0AYQ7_9ROSI|nr:hypothetical protein Dsin_006613 [Dipteronia sinensis]
MNKIYSLLLQEEKQRAFSTSANPNPDEGSALPTTQSDNQPRNKFGHSQISRYHCDHCGRYGHTIQKCYKLHGFPPRSNNGPSESVQSQSHGLAASD